MTLVDNSSNAGVEARVISSNIISGSMEAEGSNSLGLSSSTLVDNSSNAGVETRVVSSRIISGSMEAEGSNSLSLNSSNAGVEARVIIIISSSSSSSNGGSHMLLRSGALVRLVTPIACGISLSPLRLQERQCTDPTCAHGVAPEGIVT